VHFPYVGLAEDLEHLARWRRACVLLAQACQEICPRLHATHKIHRGPIALTLVVVVVVAVVVTAAVAHVSLSGEVRACANAVVCSKGTRSQEARLLSRKGAQNIVAYAHVHTQVYVRYMYVYMLHIHVCK
jgi:hypothetical protein